MTDDRRAWQGLDPTAKRELLARLLREKAARDTIRPLSHGQRALWLLYQMAPASASYNVAFTARIRSAVDMGVLREAFAALAQRHEPLRSTYLTRDAEPVQEVHPRVDVPIEEADASAWSPEELTRRLSASYARPFDLERGPVIRASVFHRGRVEHVLLVTVHHIAYDGLSIGLLVRDLLTLYGSLRDGRPAPLVPLRARYADFVRWQDELLRGPAGEEMEAYWRKALGGPLPTLELPTDKRRPTTTSFRGATHPFRIEEPIAARLRELARQEGTTLYVVLLAAFFALLNRYTGQEDILVGSPTAGRSRSEFEDLIGYFVNIVVLRADLSGDPTILEHLRRVRAVVVDALKHADFPFPLLVQRLNPDRDPSRSPLFQVDFNLVRLGQLGVAGEPGGEDGVSSLSLGGLDLEIFTIRQQEGQFDLTFEVVDTGGLLIANLKYATDLFEQATIERMSGHLGCLLEGMVASPNGRVSDLTLLTESERQRAVRDWNATARPYPNEARLHRLIEEQVKRTPDGMALSFEGRTLTYRDLNRRANQLARVLQARGVGPETLVGVLAERSLELVIALLAVLKSGGAYVPVDPSYPAERIANVLEDARAPLILAQPHLVSLLPARAAEVLLLDADGPAGDAGDDQDLDEKGSPDALAYVIFTSGSTGRPKGAMNAHRGICNRLLWMQEEYGLATADRVLQKTPYSFDVSVWEFFWPLLAGAILEVARPEGHKDPAYLVRLVQERGITTLHFVPSMLAIFLEEAGVEGCRSLRRVICSGEALPYELQERFFQRLPGVELHNLYGPTEAAVDVTHWTCRRGDGRKVVPIGHPVANTQMYVLDRRLLPVPAGVPGELFIGGVQVGRGYVARPDLTAERFVPDPFSETPGSRLYKTGDLARHLSDGAIEYLGRLDHQVKIRGFRIELGEIEAALAQHPAVGAAVVIVREDRPGDRRLVAYLTPRGEERPRATELKEQLRKVLPEYMVPAECVVLEAMPLTPSGKVDRKALPAPELDGAGASHDYVPPATAMESTISEIWATVLGKARVSVVDRFFDLGGHSLLLLQVLSRARAAGLEIAPVDMFQYPTVRALAAHLGQGAAPARDYEGVRERARRQRRALARPGRAVERE
jgi:amino acid adenylation domain-containing protein